jgi:hypothetical protein
MKPVLVTELGLTGCVGNGSCDDWPLVLFAAHAMPQPQGPLPAPCEGGGRIDVPGPRPVGFSLSCAAAFHKAAVTVCGSEVERRGEQVAPLPRILLPLRCFDGT